MFNRNRDMPSLVGICGNIGAGKDAAADYLVAEHGYEKISMAYPLKEMVATMFNLDDRQVWGSQEEKAEYIEHLPPDPEGNRWTGRRLLEFVGSDIFRSIWAEVWVHAIRQELVGLGHHCPGVFPAPVVIPDIRFDNERDLIKEFGGVLIRIEKEGNDKDQTAHPNGQYYKTAQVDAVVSAPNPGLDILHQRLVRTLVKLQIDEEIDNARA